MNHRHFVHHPFSDKELITQLIFSILEVETLERAGRRPQRADEFFDVGAGAFFFFWRPGAEGDIFDFGVDLGAAHVDGEDQFPGLGFAEVLAVHFVDEFVLAHALAVVADVFRRAL